MGEKSTQLIKSIFSVDNAFVRGCERVLDLVVLNLLFLLSCLPIVTIGVAKMSLYEVLVALKRHKRLPILSSYVVVFRKHFKQGLLLGVIELVIGGVCLLDLALMTRVQFGGGQLIQVLGIAGLFLVEGVFLYLYPMATRFEMDTVSLLKTSLLLTGLHFPWTFLMLGSFILLIVLLYCSALTFLLGVSLMLLVGFSILGLGWVTILEVILKKYPSQG